MLKKIIKRFALGFIFEVFVTYVISLLISINIGDGNYYNISPNLLTLCKTELGAASLQFILAGLLGAMFGITTLYWEIERWSLAKQTVMHFITITASMLIVAYICNWMEHSIKGFAIWIGMFIVIYVIIWIICYTSFKRKINAVNKKLAEK